MKFLSNHIKLTD